jgi:fatty-acyl-CoA synthase
MLANNPDIIISGGGNISAIEVEQVVMSHPSVLEAAVVPVPDERWGEVPKAFVSLKPGSRAKAEDTIRHVRGRIAHYKAPKQVEFGDLPKTSTGKIQSFCSARKSGRDVRARSSNRRHSSRSAKHVLHI